MKKILLICVFAIHASAGAQLQTVSYQTNELVPTFTTDQIITGSIGVGVGSIVGTFVADKTNSNFLGFVAGAVVGGSIGYAKDKWDMKNNTAIPNKYAPYNDTAVGIVSGAIGAGFKVRINLGGRKNSKNGFNGRFSIKAFKKRRR